ncbi:hypothetical protein ACSXAL_01175 [Clostridium perfringens]|uniref:hypothetical protein n=1 Tax=Clostridium perfringens TaxID=1502 RepID=UPI00285D2029|nr:hypothetical protein [Clostridium perfringens]EJT6143620.1 hypothetical protein [Clostridium perfringens]ELC8402161.1 hypothetical protein [Clostridium perfringens]MDM0560152.1 hypothetical protein [Clostridium perfringens]MDM0898856.1 hypothetical protein [Clostridium perfringens]
MKIEFLVVLKFLRQNSYLEFIVFRLEFLVEIKKSGIREGVRRYNMRRAFE